MVRAQDMSTPCLGGLCLVALPLVFFRDHLATLREVYGQNPWAPPSPVQVITGSDWLFGVRHLGFVLVMGIATGIAYRIVSLRSPPQRLNTSTSENTAESWTGITEEEVLSLGLLAVPAIGVTVATIMGGDLDPRYMLTAVVGGAIGVGLLLGSAVAPIRWFVLFASLGAYALRVPGPASELLAGTLVQRRVVAAQLLETTIRKHTNLGVPIVVSDGLQYLPLTRYIAPHLRHDFTHWSTPRQRSTTSAATPWTVTCNCCVATSHFRSSITRTSHLHIAVS